MSLLLAHLSDIHLRATSDLILGRGESIAKAIASVHADPAWCCLLLSGDLSHSGTKAQFSALKQFVDRICTTLRAHHPKMEIHVLAVPGNHDCNFTVPIQSRDLVRSQLGTMLSEMTSTSDVIELMTMVQAEIISE